MTVYHRNFRKKVFHIVDPTRVSGDVTSRNYVDADRRVAMCDELMDDRGRWTDRFQPAMRLCGQCWRVNRERNV
jgi:hypothetical protein